MNILYDEEKGQISTVIHDQRSQIDRLESDICLHEKEASELKNKAKYSSCIENATMKMLRERSMILQDLVENKSSHTYKKNGKDGMLIAERISSIVQGDNNLAKSQSSHTLRLASVKNKLKQSMKREGQGSYLTGGVTKVSTFVQESNGISTLRKSRSSQRVKTVRSKRAVTKRI